MVDPNDFATVKDAEKYEIFGRLVFKLLKESIENGPLDTDMELIADEAVESGLLAFEPFGPDRHTGLNNEYEPGHMIYYWGVE